MTTGQETTDKILDHNWLQLSALIDGELSPDEARFLLRRLQHDAELGGCWERWQLCGDVLRGQAAGLLMPRDFAASVTAAIALEPGGSTKVTAIGPRWLRWGSGAALAASVAVIALFLTRQLPEAKSPATQTQTQIAALPADTISDPRPAATQPVATAPSRSVPEQAASLATAVALADVPRRLTARRSRGQSQRAAMRTSTRSEAPVAIAVGNGMATPADLFSAQRVSLPSRPWPRALLPGSPANAFTVDYGGTSGATSASFYPFDPRTVPDAPVQDVTGRGDAPP